MKYSEGIILAFSNVREDNLKHLNPELQKIRDVLKDAEEKKYINIIEHNGVTYNSLSYLLNSDKGREVTMLHFSGHSSRKGLWVQSQDEHGIISKKPLSNLIKAHRKFRFVFLNSCSSKDIANDLIDAGVPYVIGTTDRVSDQQSAVVAAKFYSLLAKGGKTIEEAFLLTKDYVDDPLNDSDTGIKEAFRTFDIEGDEKNEYPWQLYKNPELKEKDKNWLLNPALPKIKLNKWFIAIGIIGILILSYSAMKINELKYNNTKLAADTSTVSNELKNISKDPDSLKAGTGKDNKAPKQHSATDKNLRRPSLSDGQSQEDEALTTTGKRIFAQLKIVDSANKYNHEVTNKAREIFSGKGYQLEEAGAEPSGKNYENRLSGEFTLSQPLKTKGSFNTVIVDYIVRLKLRFFDGTGKQTCGLREYSAKVSTTESDTKERVMQQGLDDVMDQLQKDTGFPFCVKK